ncbi:MAG: DUF3347 domain-containing protein [Ginsengibacter sp.]
MNKILLSVAICATVFVQQSFAQNTSVPQSSELLASYYNIKNALVNGDADKAAVSAELFVKNINGTGAELIHKSDKEALLKDANKIAATKDLKKQREYFSAFSVNMYALAKSVKLNSEPVYYQYCPMKKAYWLSGDKAIKNPYYGSAMLTCGKVTETIQ